MAFAFDLDATPDHTFEAAKTVGGSDVRIYSRETGKTGRIHGAYWANGDWHMASWFATGYANPPSEDGTQWKTKLDLVRE